MNATVIILQIVMAGVAIWSAIIALQAVKIQTKSARPYFVIYQIQQDDFPEPLKYGLTMKFRNDGIHPAINVKAGSLFFGRIKNEKNAIIPGSDRVLQILNPIAKSEVISYPLSFFSSDFIDTIYMILHIQYTDSVSSDKHGDYEQIYYFKIPVDKDSVVTKSLNSLKMCSLEDKKLIDSILSDLKVDWRKQMYETTQ